MFPVESFQLYLPDPPNWYLKKGSYAKRIYVPVPELWSILQLFLSTSLLRYWNGVGWKLNATRQCNEKNRIILMHVLLAVRNDGELRKPLARVTIAHGDVLVKGRIFWSLQ